MNTTEKIMGNLHLHVNGAHSHGLVWYVVMSFRNTDVLVRKSQEARWYSRAGISASRCVCVMWIGMIFLGNSNSCM